MKPRRIAALVVALSIGTLAPVSAVANGPASGHQDSGTLCVLPNSAKPPTRFAPGGEYNPATLTIRIDNREPIPWPHKQLVKIENLTLIGRHIIVLTSDGKPLQSFWFRFSEFKDTRLCVYFDGYQGVQLADKYSGHWC
jgi:hypothetical protein